MATYIFHGSPASREDYRVWKNMGYFGSWSQYCRSKSKFKRDGPIFINGDLGPHCSSCAAPSEYLCDFPVGDGLTCDRQMCRNHAEAAFSDTHYCSDHMPIWRAFAETRGIDAALENVVPFTATGATP